MGRKEYKENKRTSKKIKQNIKGITLVALVVTIIVLLILAGIAISLTIGNNGIIGKAKKTREEYEKAAKNEYEYLDNLYSSIKIAENDDAEITINMKTLKSIIDDRLNEELTKRMQDFSVTMDQKVNEAMSKGANGINSSSLLMESKNDDRSVAEGTLKNFSNSFTKGEFLKYFEYNSATGELTCIQDGWFLIFMYIGIGHIDNQWTSLTTYLNVNQKEISFLNAQVGAGSTSIHDSDSLSIYLKKNDKISIKEVTGPIVPTSYNNVILRIFKI